MRPRVLLAGAGGAVGTALDRHLRERGAQVICAGRDAKRLGAELDPHAELLEVDLASRESVRRALCNQARFDTLVYNAGALHLAPLLETTPEDFEACWRTNALGAFLCAHTLAGPMIDHGRGAMIFVGATASIRGGARSHAFASSKHALRGLASSLARELAPRGVHVAHVVLDGKVAGARTRARFPTVKDEECLDASAVARAIAALIEQPRAAWTFEMDLRPSVERW